MTRFLLFPLVNERRKHTAQEAVSYLVMECKVKHLRPAFRSVSESEDGPEEKGMQKNRAGNRLKN